MTLWLDDPPPPGPEAATGARMSWIRARIHAYAQDLAVEAVIDPSTLDWNRGDGFCACVAYGVKAKATADEIITAWDAEWRQDTLRAAQMLAHLRAKVWGMCRASMPREAIIRAADELMEHWRVFLPTELLDEVLGDIWDAAQPYKPRRGKHRGKA